MSHAHEGTPRHEPAGPLLGFVLFFPALVLMYLLLAGMNWLFFGSLS